MKINIPPCNIQLIPSFVEFIQVCFWINSTVILYAVRPAFMKSTPGVNFLYTESATAPNFLTRKFTFTVQSSMKKLGAKGAQLFGLKKVGKSLLPRIALNSL
jgi:hypothetical protein